MSEVSITLVGMWAALASIAGPVIAGLFAVVRSRMGGGGRRLKEHAAVLATLETGSKAYAAVEAIVVFDADAVLAAQRARAARKLNPANVATAVFLVLVTAGLAYGLVSWAQAWAEIGLAWIPIVLLATVGLFFVALTGYSLTTIYTPAKPKAG